MPIGVQLVECARAGQHFQRALADALQIHAPRQVEKRGKGFLPAPVGDQLHRLKPDILQGAERIDQCPALHLERCVGAVYAGRNPRQVQPLAHFFEVDGELVGEMDVAVHHTGHKLNRMVRLKPGCLVADNGVGGRVGFVEPVVGEFLQQVENFGGLFLVHAVFHRTLFELRALLGHFFGDLLAHRAAQQVGTAKRVSGHDLRDLHHLFLIDDDALRLFENVIDQRVNGFAVAQPVLDLAIGRDVLHRTGTVERH